MKQVWNANWVVESTKMLGLAGREKEFEGSSCFVLVAWYMKLMNGGRKGESGISWTSVANPFFTLFVCLSVRGLAYYINLSKI